MVVKDLDSPDELRSLRKTKAHVVHMGAITIMKAIFEPGWKWSECVKPAMGTKSCPVHHVGYVLSGRMKVLMDDGSSAEIQTGDAVDIPPGHDAWVIGNEPCVLIDFTGGKKYAKKV